MKKVVVVFVILSLLLSLSACGRSSDDKSNNEQSLSDELDEIAKMYEDENVSEVESEPVEEAEVEQDETQVEDTEDVEEAEPIQEEEKKEEAKSEKKAEKKTEKKTEEKKSKKRDFSPKDVSDKTIESIETYGDYLVMYNKIIDDYFDNYEKAIKGTVLYDKDTFKKQKEEMNKEFEKQKSEYEPIEDNELVGKDDFVDFLKGYRDDLKAIVDSFEDSLSGLPQL